MKEIYRSENYDPEKHCTMDTHFTPTFDSTDHLYFASDCCKEPAEILLVKRNDAYANTPTLWITMQCPKCGKSGIRKIYLEYKVSKNLRMQYPTRTKLLTVKRRDKEAPNAS